MEHFFIRRAAAALPQLLADSAEAERLRDEVDALRGDCARAWMPANSEMDERQAAQARADRLEGALREFVSVCDTAQPIWIIREIGRACELARAVLSSQEAPAP